MCWWEAEGTADVKDALIQMPVLGVGTDTGFEASTHMRKICANTATLKPVYGSCQFTLIDCKAGSEESFSAACKYFSFKQLQSTAHTLNNYL